MPRKNLSILSMVTTQVLIAHLALGQTIPDRLDHGKYEAIYRNKRATATAAKLDAEGAQRTYNQRQAERQGLEAQAAQVDLQRRNQLQEADQKDRQIQTLNSEVESLQSTTEVNAGEIRRLETAVHAEKQKEALKTTSIRTQEGVVARATQGRDAAAQSLATANQNRDQAAARLAAAQNDIAQLQSDIATIEQNNRSLGQSISDLNAERQRNDQMMFNHNAAIEKLQVERVRLEQRLKDLERTSQTLAVAKGTVEREQARLIGEIDRTNRDIADLSRKLASTQADLDAAQKQAETLQWEVSWAQADVERLQSTESRSRQKVARTEEVLASEQRELAQLQARQQEAQRALAEQVAAKERLVREEATLEAAVRQAQQEVAEAKRNAQTVLAALEQANRNVQSLRQEEVNLEQQQSNLQQQQSRLLGEIRALPGQVSLAEANLQTAKQQLADLQAVDCPLSVSSIDPHFKMEHGCKLFLVPATGEMRMHQEHHFKNCSFTGRWTIAMASGATREAEFTGTLQGGDPRRPGYNVEAQSISLGAWCAASAAGIDAKRVAGDPQPVRDEIENNGDMTVRTRSNRETFVNIRFRLKSEHPQQLAKAQKAVADAEATLAVLRNRERSAPNELQSTEASLANTESLLKDVGRRLQAARKDKRDAEEAAAPAQQRIGNAEQAVQAAQQAVTRNQQGQRQADKAVTEVQQVLKGHIDDIRVVNASIAGLQSTIAELNEFIAKAPALQDELRRSLRQDEREAQRWLAEQRRLENLLTPMHSDLARFDAARKQYEADLARVQQDVARVQAEINGVELDRQGVAQTIVNVDNQWANEAAAAQRLYDRNERIEKLVADYGRTIQSNREAVIGKNRLVRDLEQDISAKLQPALNNTDTVLAGAKNQFDAREKELSAERQMLRTFEQELATLTANRRALEQKASQSHQENVRLAGEISRRQDRVVALTSSVQSLRAGAAELAKQHASILMSIKSATSVESEALAVLTQKRQVERQTESDATLADHEFQKRRQQYDRERAEVMAAANTAGTAPGTLEASKYADPQGATAGNASGQLHGERDGRRDGEKRDYETGFAAGLVSGEQAGKADGRLAGEAKGKADGAQQGMVDGQKAGAKAGYDAGYRRAYDEHFAAAASTEEFFHAGVAQGEPQGLAEAVKTARTEDYPKGYAAAKAKLLDPTQPTRKLTVDNRAVVMQPASLAALSDIAAPIRGWSTTRRELVGSISNMCLGSGSAQPIAPAPTYEFAKIDVSGYDFAEFRDLYTSTYQAQYRVTFGKEYDARYRAAFQSSYESTCHKTYEAVLAKPYPESQNQGQKAGYDKAYSEWHKSFLERYAARQGEFSGAYQAAYKLAYDAGVAEQYPIGESKGIEAGSTAGATAGEQDARQRGVQAGRQEAFAANLPEQRQIWFTKGQESFAAELKSSASAFAVGAFISDAKGTRFDKIAKLWSGTSLSIGVVIRNFGGAEAPEGQLKVKIEAVDRARGLPASPVALKSLAAEAETTYVNVADVMVQGGHQTTAQNNYGSFHVKVTILDGETEIGSYEFKRTVDESLVWGGGTLKSGSMAWVQSYPSQQLNQGSIGFKNQSDRALKGLQLRVKSRDENFYVVGQKKALEIPLGDLAAARSVMANFFVFHKLREGTVGKKIFEFEVWQGGILMHVAPYYFDVTNVYNP